MSIARGSFKFLKLDVNRVPYRKKHFPVGVDRRNSLCQNIGTAEETDMKKMMGIKRLVAKTLCGMMVATMLMGNTAFASELDSEAIVAETETTIEDEETVEAEENAKTEATEVAEVEADTDAEEAAPEAEVEETEAEAEESEESEESKSLEDILGEVDNTASVVEDTVYVDLSLIIPENCILSKDGQVITSFEADILLTDGQITVSQPSAPDYKNRIESDVVISIIDGNISVSFEGQDVVGTVQDSLGNTVSFDGTTLQIVNSDKMESLEPSEVEIDDPDTPLAAPDSYTVRYFVDFVAEENLLHQDVVAGIVGQEIKIDTIDLNAYKPENTEALVWHGSKMASLNIICTLSSGYCDSICCRSVISSQGVFLM